VEIENGRNKVKKGSADKSPKVRGGRKTRKTVSSVSAEDLRQWLQTVRISEFHRFR
jgi:hypothetical protein